MSIFRLPRVMALSAIAALSVAILAPTSDAHAYLIGGYYPAYAYPISYAYSPVVYTAPVAYTTYSYGYSYAYPYYAAPAYYTWPGVTLGCVGWAC